MQRILRDLYSRTISSTSGSTISGLLSTVALLLRLEPRATVIWDYLGVCDESRTDLSGTIDILASQFTRPVKIFIYRRPDGDINARLIPREDIHESDG